MNQTTKADPKRLRKSERKSQENEFWLGTKQRGHTLVLQIGMFYAPRAAIDYDGIYILREVHDPKRALPLRPFGSLKFEP